MWIAKFYDASEPIEDLDIPFFSIDDDSREMVEFVDGWLKDAGVMAGYELVWED